MKLEVAVFLLSVISHTCNGGNVLVYPAEGSHWINMDILLQALHAQGHNLTVVRSNKSWYVREDSSYYNTITVNSDAGLDKEFVVDNVKKLISIQRGHSSVLKEISLHLELFQKVVEIHSTLSKTITMMFEDQALMKDIESKGYDVVLADPCWGGGTLLASYLKLPLIYNVRWLPVGEGHFAVAPSPASYIPMTGSGFTDKMTFTERVRNMLTYWMGLLTERFLLRPVYQEVCKKYLGPEADFYQLMQAADIWLMRVDFVFEFPRPTMPNIIYMGGFQCKPAEALPQHLEDFVQSSGEHGVIIMSLGAFVSDLPSDLVDEIAAAFAELPQKVIWRHTGDRPSTLGNNTLLVSWMPQKDLLGHPQVKAFVAHGGTNGVQEALYHGVPVVGLPLFFDQYDNLLRLEERGGAKILSMATLDRNILIQALQEVLHDPSYRNNMQRLSRLHRDQPMKPLDRALFWIEFVMRHKGAAHLRTESYKMPWYSYHSVDVALLLLSVLFLMLLTLVGLAKCLFKVCQKQKPKVD